MAKYLTIFLMIAVLLMAFLTLYYSKDSYKLFPIPDQQGQEVSIEEYNFQNWHEFTSPKRDFLVLLPNLPQHATENVTDQQTGENRKYEMFVSEKPDGTVFMISMITFPEETVKQDNESLMRAMMKDMMASNPENQLHQEKLSEYQGHNALDFSFGNPETRVDAKTFMIGNQLYVLSRVVKTSLYNANEYNFFVNSFELNPTFNGNQGDLNVPK